MLFCRDKACLVRNFGISEYLSDKVKKIILISILIHLLASIFSRGFYHSDEHFQILEFALLKTGVN